MLKNNVYLINMNFSLTYFSFKSLMQLVRFLVDLNIIFDDKKNKRQEVQNQNKKHIKILMTLLLDPV